MTRPMTRPAVPVAALAALVAAPLAALVPATAWSAQDPDFRNFYVGAAVGRSHQSIDCSGTTDCHRAANAAKVWVGWPMDFDRRLSVELMYDDLGTAKTDTSSGSADTDAKFWGLGLAGRTEFTPFFGGTLRGGLARVSTTWHGVEDGVPFSRSRNGTNHGYIGLALDWRLNDNLRVQVGVDGTRVAARRGTQDITYNAAAWSAGFVAGF